MGVDRSRLWLLEPETVLCELLRDLFVEEQLAVEVCNSPSEITRALLRGEYGIAVADLDELSFREGWSVTRHFATLSRLVPVLLLTNRQEVSTDDVGTCQLLPDAFADLEGLLTVVRGLLRQPQAGAPQTHGSF
jgi:DNA-binding response OmpR family regulator